MSLVAVVGDVATTTATALTAGWPVTEAVVLLEADPTGGDLAAWFDLATAPGLVSAVAAAPSGSWLAIREYVQHSNGIDVLVTPGRAGDAEHVVGEAASRIVPTLARLDDVVTIADCGTQHPLHLSPIAVQAGLVVLTIYPSVASDRAVAVQLDRHGELLDTFTRLGIPVVAAVVTGGLYDTAEVAAFLGGITGPAPVVEIAHDPTAARMIAGRAAGRAKIARSPLLRSATKAALVLSARVRVGMLDGAR